MLIDAREIELQELFVRLREIMCNSSGKEVMVDVLISDDSDCRKVTSFASMSGYRTTVENKEEHCVVRISGYACCV